MPEEEITGEDIIRFVSLQLTPEGERTVFSDIWDWIASVTSSVVDAVSRWFWGIWDTLKAQLSNLWVIITNPIKIVIDKVHAYVDAVFWKVVDVYTYVRDWVTNAWTIVSSAVSSAIAIVSVWISGSITTITTWITTEVAKVSGWITTSVTNLTTSIQTWFTQQWTNISSLFATLGANISQWFTSITISIATFFTDLWTKIEASFTWLTTWMAQNIVEPLATWWDQFIDRILDFGAWVGKLLDAVAAWLTVDIPGSSPRWTKIFEDIGHWFATWFYEFPKWFAADIPERTAYGLYESFSWVGERLNPFIEEFNNTMISFARSMGPMSPEQSITNFSSVAKVGIAAIGGLAGMTIAGELLHPLKSIGLGNLAAVIYDMTNYKVITGAMIGALATSVIKTPLSYYFNDLFRPWLLDRRNFMDLLSRRAFTDPESLQNPALTTSVREITGGQGHAFEKRMIGYYGHPANYYGLYKELANTPLRYFPLAGIARTGYYDDKWFTEALHRSGYSETAVRALMVMYRKEADDSVRGAMSGAAVTRYKEGFTTEEQFRGEMTILGYSGIQFDTYLAAAKMDYATDYLRDLLAAYRDAVRKGNLSMDEYRRVLLRLGIVPERVEAYVLRERARLKPKEPLTPISPATPAYETDQGKVIVDTTRRQRRKLLITKDEEIAALIKLGMEPNYATAIADNDDVRLAEKGGEE